VPEVKSPSTLAQERFQSPRCWRWHYFRNADGAQIRYGHARIEDPKAVIAILPGIIECAENYFETVRELLDYQCSVWVMDWRGQGGSQRYLPEREKAYSLGIEHDVSDINAFINLVVEKSEGVPLILIGHSFAGAPALIYLQSDPGLVSSAVLVAPAFSVSGPVPAWITQVVAEFHCAIGLGKTYAPGQGNWQKTRIKELDLNVFSHDPVRLGVSGAWLDENPHLRTGGATWTFVKEFQNACIKAVNPLLLKSIKIPVLIICPGDDQIAEPKLQKRVTDELANGRFIFLPKARHALFMESDEFRDPLLTGIKEFIDNQIQAQRCLTKEVVGGAL
jgi:lysophospholipase